MGYLRIFKNDRNFKEGFQYYYFLPIVILLVIAFYLILTMSSNVRFWADDFCIASVQQKYGLLKAQYFWWTTWSGRYSYNLVLHIFASLGEGVIRWIPLLIYLCLILAILPAFQRIFKDDKRKWRNSLLVSIFIITLILINAPNIIQSFYWQNGSLIYLMPFVFLNLFLATIVIGYYSTKDLEIKSLILPFLLTFIAGGFVETFAFALSAMILVTIIASFFIDFPKKSRTRKLLLAGLAGSIISMIVMLYSPGIQIRQGTLSPKSDLMFVIKSTLLGAKWYLLRFFSIRTSIYSLFSLFSLIYFMVSQYLSKIKKIAVAGFKNCLTIAGWSVFSMVVSTVAVFFVSYYAMSYLPPERALLIVVYFILLACIPLFVSVSLIINVYLEKKKGFINILALSVFLVSITLLTRSFYFRWVTLNEQMRDYAIKWDIEEQRIYEQKGKGEDITIRYIKPPGDLDGFIENEGWVSACAASYYQVDEIRVVE